MTTFDSALIRPSDPSPFRKTPAGRILAPGEELDLCSSVLLLKLCHPTGHVEQVFFLVDGLRDDMAQAAVDRYRRDPSPLVRLGLLAMASGIGGLVARLTWSDDPERCLVAAYECGTLQDIPSHVVVPHEWATFSSRFMASIEHGFPAWQRLPSTLIKR